MQTTRLSAETCLASCPSMVRRRSPLIHAQLVKWRTMLLAIVCSGVYDSTFNAMWPCALPRILCLLMFQVALLHPSPRTWPLGPETRTLWFVPAPLTHVRAYLDLIFVKLLAATRWTNCFKGSVVSAPWSRAPRLMQPCPPHLHPPRCACIFRMPLRLHCLPAMEGIHAVQMPPRLHSLQAMEAIRIVPSHTWVEGLITLACGVLSVSLLVLKSVMECLVLPQQWRILILIEIYSFSVWFVVLHVYHFIIWVYVFVFRNITDWHDTACVICNENPRTYRCEHCHLNMCIDCLEREFDFDRDSSDESCPHCKKRLSSATRMDWGDIQT